MYSKDGRWGGSKIVIKPMRLTRAVVQGGFYTASMNRKEMKGIIGDNHGYKRSATRTKQITEQQGQQQQTFTQ
jgi:hypothetical protein